MDWSVFLWGAMPKVMGQMERGKGKRDAAYFYSVHLLPQSFLPFPLLPSTPSPQNKHTSTWISDLLCVWSTPLQHNEWLSSQRYGKYFFQIFRRLINCSKLGGDTMISHVIYPPCSFVSLIYLKWYNTWTSISSFSRESTWCILTYKPLKSKKITQIEANYIQVIFHISELCLVDDAFSNGKYCKIMLAADIHLSSLYC